jgi:creatinine amidohydrolase/Fe(II)-dependent formamide hydrolase-like protein
MMQNGIHTISTNGVLGDQRQANAERGERYLDGLADWLVADIKRQASADE